MGVAIFFLCFLLMILVYDLQLRLFYFLDPKNSLSMFSRMQRVVFNRFLTLARTYTGFEVIRESKLKTLPRQFLLVSNHQSLIDIPILACAFPHHPVRFVAKKELKWGLPAFSFALRKGNYALVDRKGDFKTSLRQLRKLAGTARHGICPAVFPEGTRSRTGKVGFFHSAAVRAILEKADLPVLSVAVDGGYRIAGLKEMIRNLRGGYYRVKILSLYPAVRKREKIIALLGKAQEEIARQTEEWKREWMSKNIGGKKQRS